MLNRFRFTALALVPALLLSLVTGCFSQSQIAGLTQILGTQAANIAKLEGNSTLSAKLTTDTAAAVTAINGWTKGSATTEIVEALNLVEDDLNLIPIASQYAPLVDLAIGTAEEIISLFPASTAPTTAVKAHVALHKSVPPVKVKDANDFKAQNNAIAKANNLPQAVIQ